MINSIYFGDNIIILVYSIKSNRKFLLVINNENIIRYTFL